MLLHLHVLHLGLNLHLLHLYPLRVLLHVPHLLLRSLSLHLLLPDPGSVAARMHDAREARRLSRRQRPPELILERSDLRAHRGEGRRR